MLLKYYKKLIYRRAWGINIMKVVKCDCNGCNEISVKMNKVTINLEDGNTKVYDICNNCLNKITSVINGEVPKVQTEVPKVQKKNKKGEVVALLKEYGFDRLKTEYIDNNRSAQEIADELGISKIALAQSLSRLGITKRNHNKEHRDANNETEGN